MNDSYLNEYEIPTIKLNDGYLENKNSVFDVITPSSTTMVSLEKDILSPEILKLFKHKLIKNVFSFLSECVQGASFSNFVLSKLVTSEATDEDVVVEWNYNYFRTYFYFDLVNQDDSEVGLIANKGKDTSIQTINLTNSNYKDVISKVCNFALKKNFNL